MAPTGVGAPPGPEIPTGLESGPISNITELASGQINGTASIIIELMEADETPAVVIIRWPAKPTVLHRNCSPPLLTAPPASSQLPSYGWPRSDPTGSCEPNLHGGASG